jgi:polyferredoxin
LRLLILVLSLVIGLLPLAGVAWIFASGMITLSPPSMTVDGLFMSLILLTLSGCILLNAYWEMRDQGFLGKKQTAPAKAPAAKAS